MRFFRILECFDHFRQFLDFGGFYRLFGFFLFFFVIFWIFLDFLNFLDSFKVNKVTTKCYHGYYWTPKIAKMGRNSIKSTFFARRAKKASAEGRSPPQELEVGPRSRPYLLVFIKAVSPISSVFLELARDTEHLEFISLTISDFI